MNLKLTDGYEVRVSFWTDDAKLCRNIRKLLMNNMIKFDWTQRLKQDFKPVSESRP